MLRKTLTILAIYCMGATLSSAQLFSTGTQEISGAGLIDFSSTDGTRAVLEGGYGVYIMDYVQVGGEAVINRSGSAKIHGVGATAEYDFDFGWLVYPFVGTHLQLVNYDTNDKNGMALVLGVKAGAMVFIAENIAVSASLVGDVASSEIYANDDKNASTDLQIRLGLRFFY